MTLAPKLVKRMAKLVALLLACSASAVARAEPAPAAAPAPRPAGAAQAPAPEEPAAAPAPAPGEEPAQPPPAAPAKMWIPADYVPPPLPAPQPAPARPPRKPEEPVAPGMMLHLGVGLSAGFFSPGLVNAWMRQWRDDLPGLVTVQSGDVEMSTNFVPRLTLNFAPITYLQIQAVGELGWSPKFISVNSKMNYFEFMRYSVGGNLVGHLPLKNHRLSLFLGAGALYHVMKFKDFEGATVGFRALIGVRVYVKRIAPELFLAFDYANAPTGRTFVSGSTSTRMELNYTGVIVGFNFYFNLLKWSR